MRLDQLLPGIADLRSDDVQAYLRARGFSHVEDLRGVAFVYADPNGNEAIVPRSRDLRDYARRLAELVEMLARVEARTPLEIVEDLSLPPGDLLTFRIQSDMVGSGTIPLQLALQIREAQKNILLAAAHSEVVPERYFPRMSRTEPMELLASCREGQTGRGSYITKLLVPVEPAVGRLPLEDPYGRRVTRLLMETLHVVEERLSRADDEGLLREPPAGLSYNLLAALAEMKPPGERSTLDIGVRWSRARPPPPAATPAKVLFNEPQFATMSAIAGALREQTPTTCQIEGYVARLSRSGDDPNAEGRVVILTTFEERLVETRVHLTLPAREYNDVALPAHKEGRRIRVSGVLRRTGRTFELGNPIGFTILPGEQE